jgi:hypothetical protein
LAHVAIICALFARIMALFAIIVVLFEKIAVRKIVKLLF